MDKIAFDLDGVIYTGWHYGLWLEQFIHNKTKSDYYTFWEKDIKQYAPMMWYNLVRIPFLYSYKPISKDIQCLVKKLSEKYEIFYLTVRPEEAYFSTRSWIEKSKLPFTENLYFCNGDKTDEIRALDIDWLIDDRIEIADSARKYCAVILIEQPWNTNEKERHLWVGDILEIERIFL